MSSGHVIFLLNINSNKKLTEFKTVQNYKLRYENFICLKCARGLLKTMMFTIYKFSSNQTTNILN